MICNGFIEKNWKSVNGLNGQLIRLALLYPSNRIC